MKFGAVVLAISISWGLLWLIIPPQRLLQPAELERLQRAYPDYIKAIYPAYVLWVDGTRIPIYGCWGKLGKGSLENPTLADHMMQACYVSGLPENRDSYYPTTDSGRIRYEPLLRKMYGSSPEAVKAHLIKMAWMPKVFGADTYLLDVTTVNGVHEKLQAVSEELEELVLEHPEYKKFLENPGGTFAWRMIANSNRLSSHSFGMTIDINTDLSHYWQWDLERAGLPVVEHAALAYRNEIPWAIVLIFERYGFIWGGKWRHYDTMHFEYRPELFLS